MPSRLADSVAIIVRGYLSPARTGSQFRILEASSIAEVESTAAAKRFSSICGRNKEKQALSGTQSCKDRPSKDGPTNVISFNSGPVQFFIRDSFSAEPANPK